MRPFLNAKSIIFGIPVDAVTLEEALLKIDEAIEKKKRTQIGVVNAAKIVNMCRNKALRDDVLSSDMIFADGTAVVWASRLLKSPLPERVAGIDLMFGMLNHGNQKRYKVYCLGATEEVSEQVSKKIASLYPNVQIAGRMNGYFSSEEEESIANRIKEAGPDILFVAMTSPKKENFLAKWSDYMNVPVCHGVGGSFDVLAGKVQRAPEIWQRLGLEWLYRVKQEPRRLWRRYLVTNFLFCYFLLKEYTRLTFMVWKSNK